MAKKIKWTLWSIAFLLVIGIGYYTYAFIHFSNSIQSKPGDSKLFGTLTANNFNNGESFIPPKWEGRQRVNILLLGGDSRGLKKNEIPRSDSLIVASIDPITKKAHLFSILRDTYVKIPGGGEDRINAALAIGGPNLAMKTVSDLLGIPVQYYVYTDFKGFIALVDSLGGIDLEVEKDMKYSDAEDGHEYDIDLKKGMQHLNGKSALQYVRFRHDALSDFARTERQRKFLQAVINKMQSTSSLIKLPLILSSMDPYIETNLTTTDMLKLGSLGYEAKTEGMVSQQIPPSELLIEKRVGGADVISVNRDRLQQFIQALLDGRDPVSASKEAAAKEALKETPKNNGASGNPGSSVKMTPPIPGIGTSIKTSGNITPSTGNLSEGKNDEATTASAEEKNTAVKPISGTPLKSNGADTSAVPEPKSTSARPSSGPNAKNNGPEEAPSKPAAPPSTTNNAKPGSPNTPGTGAESGSTKVPATP